MIETRFHPAAHAGPRPNATARQPSHKNSVTERSPSPAERPNTRVLKARIPQSTL
jgi:hypothetical protein